MAHWPYNTAAWQRLRRLKLSTQPLCEGCAEIGITAVANTVDHVTPISEGGEAFPALDGLASYCPSCHSAKTARGTEAGAVKTAKPRKGCDADGRPLDAWHPWGASGHKANLPTLARPADLRPCLSPLTILFGPPGAGKSTYARGAMQGHDKLIDLDDIMAKLAGTPTHHAPDTFLPRALAMRNAELARLANVRVDHRTFLIIAAPTAHERDWWRAHLRPDDHLLIMPERGTCVARLRKDETRGDRKAEHIRACYRWFARFTESIDDKIAQGFQVRTGAGPQNIVSSSKPGPRPGGD
jgi:5-methylcytosine-specific restriction protein A